MSEINGKVISRLLNRVHLNGLIPECLLKIKDGKASIFAYDFSKGSFAVWVESPIESEEDLEIGLSDLGVIQKFLAKSENVKYVIKANKESDATKITFVKQSKERTTFLLKEVIESSPEELRTFGDFTEDSKCNFTCDKNFIEKLMEYAGLLNLETVTVSAKNGKIDIYNDSVQEKSFKVPGVAETDSKDVECASEVHISSLVSILKIALEDENKTEIYLGQDDAIVIKNNEDFWALLPIRKED